MTIVVPVSRGWCAPYFFRALAASDVPLDARLLLVMDGDDACSETWENHARTYFSDILLAHSGFSPFPSDYDDSDPEQIAERRARHLGMTKRIQAVLPDDGLVLRLEDDTLVPSDVFQRLLMTLRRSKAVAATGVQVSRHGFLRAAGLWRIDGNRYWTLSPTMTTHPVIHVDACGEYCLLTQAAFYKHASADLAPAPLDAVDRAHTYRLNAWGTIYADWDCGCGHLLLEVAEGMPYIIHPIPEHTIHYAPREEPIVKRIPMPDGRSFFADFDDKNLKAPPVSVRDGIGDNQIRKGTYRTQGRIFEDGVLLHAPNTDIPIAEAIRLGLIEDPTVQAKPFPKENKVTFPPSDKGGKGVAK